MIQFTLHNLYLVNYDVPIKSNDIKIKEKIDEKLNPFLPADYFLILLFT